MLDIGWGKGGIATSCALSGVSVVGVDIEEDDLNIAQSRSALLQLKNISFIQTGAENLPYPDESFDLVFATSVLEHVNDINRVTREMARMTKKGGYCVIIGPNPLYPREGYYRVFCPPFLPKRIMALYLKLFGFNPEFFMESVTFPYSSISKLSSLFSSYGMATMNITQKQVLEKIDNPELISNVGMKKRVCFLGAIKLNSILKFTVSMIPFYPSIILYIEK